MKLITENWNKFLVEEAGEDIEQRKADQEARRAAIQKKVAIRQKADEMVDFAGFEQKIDAATDAFEKSYDVFEQALESGDRAQIQKAQEGIKAAAAGFRKAMMGSSAVIFKMMMTIKQLGGTLDPEEEKLLDQAYAQLQKNPEMVQQASQMQGGAKVGK